MNKRILVVEDQPDNRQIIRDMLAPTDYEITEAEDAGGYRKTATRSHLDGYSTADEGRLCSRKPD
jgi:CheY-like chemotaxis protein